MISEKNKICLGNQTKKTILVGGLNMKKIIVFVLAFMMLLAFAGCSGAETNQPAETGADTSEAPEQGRRRYRSILCFAVYLTSFGQP
jgi:hypothetical protein